MPIFDAGRNSANLKATQAAREIAVAQYEKAIQQAFREVADALSARGTLTEQLRAQEAQAAAEAERLRLVELRFANGASSSLELLDAQRASFAAQQAALQVRLAALQSGVQLYKTLGGGAAAELRVAFVVSDGFNMIDLAERDGVRIDPFTRLKDVRLGAGTEVRAHCDLDGVVAEGAVQIGPYARLRPGTVLADGVHIGNFVETKKAVLGVGSKANHLTYLGDAQVGAGVNVGAGTITCNYDGVNKSTTTIGDGAFIGSNSSLVAPVEIGANATIGAGSVVTHDAPADALTVSRARQVTLEHWKRPQKKPKD